MPDRRRFAIVVTPIVALLAVLAAILSPAGAAPAAAQGAEPAPDCFEITVGWRICAAPAVVGPLLVISERVGAEQASDDGEIEVRRVSLYDVGTGKYWSAFDYRNERPGGDHVGRSAVRPAGTSLIVWSMEQVARVALTGHTEAVLFEHAEIRAVKVSPDGTKVAILYGEPGTLVVVDAVSGVEVFRHGARGLSNWHANGTALGITDGTPGTQPTQLLGLDGAIRVLPDDWRFVSPDLRYALRFGELRGYDEFVHIWERWDVIEVETGDLLWSIAPEGGIAQLSGIWLRQSKYVTFWTPLIGAKILDTATGEIRSLSLEVERMIRSPALITCRSEDPYHLESRPISCAVEYEGRVVWQGAQGWTRFHGMVEPPTGVALRGITFRAVTREPVPPAPPSREATVGPFLLYSVKGDYVAVADGAESVGPTATRRVLAYDAGTGRSWLVLTHHAGDAVQAAQAGIVAAVDGGLFYVRPDGQMTKLSGHQPDPWDFRVSPDGRKVVVLSHGSDDLVVFALPSGDQLLRVSRDDLMRASGEVAPEGGFLFVALNQMRNPDDPLSAWTHDSKSILIQLGVGAGLGGEWIRAGTVTLDGEIAFLHGAWHPDPVEPESEPRASTDCPDNPSHSCRILLDGEVVGEGRWPIIIGVVEFD